MIIDYYPYEFLPNFKRYLEVNMQQLDAKIYRYRYPYSKLILKKD